MIFINVRSLARFALFSPSHKPYLIHCYLSCILLLITSNSIPTTLILPHLQQNFQLTNKMEELSNIFHNITVNVRRPDSTSATVNLGKAEVQ